VETIIRPLVPLLTRSHLRRREIPRTGNAAQVPQVNRLLESLQQEQKLTFKKTEIYFILKRRIGYTHRKERTLKKVKN
jgi:hypothetical protein